MRPSLLRPLPAIWLIVALPALGRAQPDSVQITTATLPLPETMRAGAAVIGWSDMGEQRQIRPGSNGMICVADEPGDDRFRCACYPESLHPLLSRSRELRARGLVTEERDRLLEEEVKAGRISLPEHPAVLHLLSGPAGAYDADIGSVSDQVERRRILFTPYRTAQQMGLPTQRHGDMPWVMASGKLMAHIMIVEAGGDEAAAEELPPPQ